MVLAEGVFYPDAYIEAEEGKLQEGIETPGRYRAVRTIRYQADFGSEESEAKDTIRLRVYAGDLSKHAAAGILTGDTIELTEAQRSGEYLVFDAAAQGEIVLLEKRGIPHSFWGIVAALAAAAVVLAGYLVHRRKKHLLRKRFEKRIAERKQKRALRKENLLEKKKTASKEENPENSEGAGGNQG